MKPHNYTWWPLILLLIAGATAWLYHYIHARKTRKALGMPLWFPGLNMWLNDRLQHRVAMAEAQRGADIIRKAREKGELPLPDDQKFDNPSVFLPPHPPVHKHHMAYLGRNVGIVGGHLYEFVCSKPGCDHEQRVSIVGVWGFLPKPPPNEAYRRQMNTHRIRFLKEVGWSLNRPLLIVHPPDPSWSVSKKEKPEDRLKVHRWPGPPPADFDD